MSTGKPYEELLQAMLGKVPSNVDKREGSIIYDALAPCAYFLAQQNFQIGNFIDLVFADTAVGEYLDLAASASNIMRKPPTAAVRKMEASASVALGTRWGIGGLVYAVSGERGGNVYEASCETAGVIGNQYSGSLQPISNITGVTAELQEVIAPGTDGETDDALRERLFRKIRLPSTSGNQYDYYNWAMECDGVGAAKVFPLANGPGTVKVVVADTGMSAAPAALVAAVKDHIEGLRPIGADVTVASATERAVNVSARVYLESGASLGAAQNAFQSALREYLQGNAFALTYVSLAHIGSLLLGTAGVADYGRLQLNGAGDNVRLGQEEIAVAGAVALEVAV